MTNLDATLLGLVQGLTEFLPISSSGHLIVTSALLGLTGESVATFEIAIQFGSILAVVVLYYERFFGLINIGKDKGRPFSGMRGLFLLFLTCLPASLVGLVMHSFIKTHLFNPVSVACALIVGALFILFTESKTAAKQEEAAINSIDDIAPKTALCIGLFQCLSLWPGFSRSTSTIMGGLLLGANRATAAEYSFIAAVPIMVAATGFSLLSDIDKLSSADIPLFAIGCVMAFVSALAAIKILVGLVSRISFRAFAWYRLAIALIILYVWM